MNDVDLCLEVVSKGPPIGNAVRGTK